MKATMTTGKHHFIVVVAEGVGNSKDMCYYIQQRTGVETRLTVLGHVQRGGDATAMERVYASAMGYRAIELLEEGVGSRIVGVKENRIYDIDIDEALAMKKDINELFYKVLGADHRPLPPGGPARHTGAGGGQLPAPADRGFYERGTGAGYLLRGRSYSHHPAAARRQW